MIQPIPLTDEWLLKFGFSFNPDWCIYYLNVDINFRLRNDDPLPDETNFKIQHVSDDDFYLSIEGFTWGQPIRYAHQLQNLYFALTGEELTIKK